MGLLAYFSITNAGDHCQTMEKQRITNVSLTVAKFDQNYEREPGEYISLRMLIS